MEKTVSDANIMETLNAAHILYVYEEKQHYLNNIIGFLRTGIEKGDHMLMIENQSVYREIEGQFLCSLSQQQRECVHFIDNHSFYEFCNTSGTSNVWEHFKEILSPVFDSQKGVHTWAHMEWASLGQDAIDGIKHLEDVAGEVASKNGALSVCAYSASDVSASFQNNLMRTHKYLMTDKEIVLSPMYRCSR
ncbi:MEDS domain-containing protein [Thalassobacillus devorans]|uniref:MEDS domain-containing protein n=1 Tax=Thalassobacillus devorans TaxID=279813 RepID=UPI000A1CC40D|nr:MEDS domain-containing protein [Thalassobacillus devorans]